MTSKWCREHGCPTHYCNHSDVAVTAAPEQPASAAQDGLVVRIAAIRHSIAQTPGMVLTTIQQSTMLEILDALAALQAEITELREAASSLSADVTALGQERDELKRQLAEVMAALDYKVFNDVLARAKRAEAERDALRAELDARKSLGSAIYDEAWGKK